MRKPASMSFPLERARRLAGALFFCLLAAAAPARSQAQVTGEKRTGTAVVIDGDTLDIAGEHLRLEGIDAPEIAQSCTGGDGKPWPCGREAARALRRLTTGHAVVCDDKGRDTYGRLLAVCTVEGEELNAAMVQIGYAWAFIKFSTAYVAQENQARAQHLGIWQGPAETAWDFRDRTWREAQKAVANGCVIKGNISNGGRIYHLPWSPWYARITIDSSRGEAWFCSESEARAAGWRPSRAHD